MQVSSSTGKFVSAALQPRRFKRYHDNAEDDNNDNNNDNNNNNNDDDDDDGLTQDEKMERETRRRRRDGSTSQGTPLFTAVHASTTNSRDAANRPARLTTQHLVNFYQRCNPSGFHYNSAFNPRRLLTKNGRACLNHGYDNEHNDLILYVNMALEPTQEEQGVVVVVLLLLQPQLQPLPLFPLRQAAEQQPQPQLQPLLLFHLPLFFQKRTVHRRQETPLHVRHDGTPSQTCSAAERSARWCAARIPKRERRSPLR